MCKQCEKNPVYEFTNQRKLCARCFIRYFQKKVFYIIRKFKMIKKDDVIGYENKGDFRGVVIEDVLRGFAEKAMIELVKLPNRRKTNKIAITSTIDLESNKIINSLIYDKLNKLKEVSPVEKINNQTFIKPLYLFLDEEVLLYAKLKRLKFLKKQKLPKNKVFEFINELEKKHPEIKRAIVNTYLKLYKPKMN